MRDFLRKTNKEAIADIEHVQGLLRIWDPIGVLPGPGDDQGPMDEYDSYAPQLVTLLSQGASIDKIQERLDEIRTKSMGLDSYHEKDRFIAEQLVSWWKNKAAVKNAAVNIASPELEKLIIEVRHCIIEQPTDFALLTLSLENLLLFLTTPSGRTKQNYAETDLYFSLHDDNGLNWGHLPAEYQFILDDLGGQLHDAIVNPTIAKNFDSTPEQLLVRIRTLKNKYR